MTGDTEALSNGQNSTNNPYENFGKHVRVSRETMGKGQAWLSERLRTKGVPLSKTALSRLESGERAVKLAEAVALCDILEIDLTLRDLGSEVDELAALEEAAALRVSEAQEDVRVAQAELGRAEARRDARKALRDAAREPSGAIEWPGTSSSFLSTAFGRDHGAARIALLAVGVPEDQLKDERIGNLKARGHFYRRIKLGDWVPGLRCTED